MAITPVRRIKGCLLEWTKKLLPKYSSDSELIRYEHEIDEFYWDVTRYVDSALLSVCRQIYPQIRHFLQKSYSRNLIDCQRWNWYGEFCTMCSVNLCYPNGLAPGQAVSVTAFRPVLLRNLVHSNDIDSISIVKCRVSSPTGKFPTGLFLFFADFRWKWLFRLALLRLEIDTEKPFPAIVIIWYRKGSLGFCDQCICVPFQFCDQCICVPFHWFKRDDAMNSAGCTEYPDEIKERL